MRSVGWVVPVGWLLLYGVQRLRRGIKNREQPDIQWGLFCIVGAVGVVALLVCSSR